MVNLTARIVPGIFACALLILSCSKGGGTRPLKMQRPVSNVAQTRVK